jgi:hypothetical protein
MFIQKSEHQHQLTTRARPTRVTIRGVDARRYVLCRECTLKGCTYSEAYDMVKEMPQLVPKKGDVDGKTDTGQEGDREKEGGA